MNLIALLTVITGLLIGLLSVPLILGRVPPNRLYGIRTRAAFTSEADWYRINAIGGRYLLGSAAIICAVGIVGFFLPASAFHAWSIATAIVTIVAVLAPCLRLCLLKPAGK